MLKTIVQIELTLYYKRARVGLTSRICTTELRLSCIIQIELKNTMAVPCLGKGTVTCMPGSQILRSERPTMHETFLIYYYHVLIVLAVDRLRDHCYFGVIHSYIQKKYHSTLQITARIVKHRNTFDQTGDIQDF